MLSFCHVAEFTSFVAKKLYPPPINKIDIILEINPITIPSIMNGVLINPLVAPTYFIIEISFLLACTVSFIVFEIINSEIKINIAKIVNVTTLIAFPTLDYVSIVLDLFCISFTLSNLDIASYT